MGELNVLIPNGPDSLSGSANGRTEKMDSLDPFLHNLPMKVDFIAESDEDKQRGGVYALRTGALHCLMARLSIFMARLWPG